MLPFGDAVLVLSVFVYENAGGDRMVTEMDVTTDWFAVSRHFRECVPTVSPVNEPEEPQSRTIEAPR